MVPLLKGDAAKDFIEILYSSHIKELTPEEHDKIVQSVEAALKKRKLKSPP